MIDAQRQVQQSQSFIIPGMNGRFFPNNWRPAAGEIAFAQQIGFQAMQFAVRDEGLSVEKLGESFAAAAAQLTEAGITPVMEIVMALDETGCNHRGQTPLEILQANLPAIQALGVYAAHWHLCPRSVWT
ncbi:MAG: hypothetical protein R2932_38140 [Caldilineaceae bacterium]